MNDSIQQKALQIEQGVIKKFDDITEFIDECSPLNPLACIPHPHIIHKLTQAYLDAEAFIADQQQKVADLGKQLIDLQTAVAKEAADQADAFAKFQLALADNSTQVGLNVASTTLDQAKEYAKNLDDLVKKDATQEVGPVRRGASDARDKYSPSCAHPSQPADAASHHRGVPWQIDQGRSRGCP